MQYFQKLIQKDLGFGCTLDEIIPTSDRAAVWTLHRGRTKDTHEPVLVFHHDPTKAPSKTPLAKTAHIRLKTLRHPDILKYHSSIEAPDGTLYLATEPAVPLATLLANGPPPHRDTLQWGLFTIARALAFLHDANLIHARLNPASIFITPTGDWKLAGFECLTPHASAPNLSQHVALQKTPYQSPEFARGNWASVAAAAPSAVDSWALGCLMYEAHAGALTTPDQLQNLSAMPNALHSAYQKLLASNPTARAPAAQIPNHPYFQHSKFIELNIFVENLALKGQLEREAFLGRLPSIMDRLPDAFCTFKILPMLSQSIETGAGGSAAFACVIKMSTRLSEDDFANNVVRKYATAWYGNQAMDRNLKVELYGQMDLFVPHFETAALNSTVFPAMCASFQDMQAPALRDAAVKSILSICDKLTDKNLNSVLMSHFARLQVDPEPAIRTNTTVCLGKLAPKLSQSARNKVLAAAFLRSLKDPFPHARAAGVNAILITSDTYNVKDIATRLLPAIIPLLIDGSGDVRKLAFKVTADFQQRLVQNHETMSRTEETSAVQQAQNGNVGNAGTSKAAGTSSSGWGLSSFSSMTAALLTSKTETPSQSTSTGISSEDFKKGPPANGIASHSSTTAATTGGSSMNATGSSAWGGMNGTNGVGATPAAFSGSPLPSKSKPSDIGGFGRTEGQVAFNNDDDDEDGWGDMDIKSSSNVDEEDLFVSMMGGKSNAAPKSMPMGNSRSTSTASSAVGSKASGGDLWDLAPPLVSKPKPRPPPTRPATSGMGIGSRRNKKSTGDDWEALLGGTGGSSKRRTAGRGSGR